jgi:hypothetical protein
MTNEKVGRLEFGDEAGFGSWFKRSGFCPWRPGFLISWRRLCWGMWFPVEAKRSLFLAFLVTGPWVKKLARAVCVSRFVFAY